jgi:plasmid stabilization system protein ParE
VHVYLRTAAREDILRQFIYYLVEKDVALVAQRFLDAVESTIESLCRMPEMGAPKFFDNPKLAGLRSWPVSGFSAIRIHYLYARDELRIVRVLHGKRDIGPLLEGAGEKED